MKSIKAKEVKSNIEIWGLNNWVFEQNRSILETLTITRDLSIAPQWSVEAIKEFFSLGIRGK